MVGIGHLPAIGRPASRAPNQMETPMETLDRIFDLTGRVAVITGAMAASVLASRRRWPPPAATSRSGAAILRRNRAAAATMAGCAGKVDARVCDVTDFRLREGRDRGHAGDIRPGRWLFCQCRHRRRRTARLHRPYRRTMAQHVRHQSRWRLSRVPGGGTAHDRTRRSRRSLWPAGRDLEPGLAVRHRAQRALRPRPRQPSTRWSARSRSNWRARASPPTPSCRAGSKAT